MNCPFYGYSMFRSGLREGHPFILISTTGNQCGLIVDAHSPCLLDVARAPVEWRDCPLIRSVRLETPPPR